MGSTRTPIGSVAIILTSLLLTQTTAADRSKWTGHNDNNSYYQPDQPYQNKNSPISIDILDEQGRRYTKHQQNNRYTTHRAYLEAKKGQRYKLRVRNRTHHRIAVVIAVDGRNIISGKKSNLRNNERMYVLGPYKSATYKGWRTGQNKVNRFYFTSAGDSYAGAWGDHSAMGVIAAAVYEEKPHYPQHHSKRSHKSNSMAAAPQAKRSSPAAEAGTGYGSEAYSASIRVEFRPKSAVAGKYFYKYEWRETLCTHGVIQCNPPPTYYQPENRFWPYNQGQGAYAPTPPRYNWK